MNKLQKEAYREGVLMISQGLKGNHKIISKTLNSWVDGFANEKNVIEKKHTKVIRNAEGDIDETISLEITNSQYCAWRLFGAFHMIEEAAKSLNKIGVVFSDTVINFQKNTTD